MSTLDLEGRRVLLEGGGERSFDKLLIASGATPRRLDVPGADLEGVHVLRTLGNSTSIRDAARRARHAVVIGAGFIGMEVAASLKQLGLEVTLVHRGKGLFEILRARQLMQFLADLYAREGVELVLGDEVQSFGGRSALDSVETARGRVIQAELAVVGIGVAPVTSWLEDSGLKLDDGVVVNERFETGVENVWAVGDVARFYDPLFGKHRRIEHWSNANYAGAEVGKLIAGGEGGFDTVSAFFSEVFGLTFRVFGDVDDVDDIVFRGALEDGKAIAFYVRDGRTHGGTRRRTGRRDPGPAEGADPREGARARPGAPRRRERTAGRGLRDLGRPPQPLDVGAAALGLEPAFLGRLARLRGDALAVDVQRLSQLLDEALDGELAVPQLAALVLRHRAERRAGLRDDPALLVVGQRRRALDVEDRLHAGLRGVRVLTSRAAGPGDAELDLGERQGDAAGDPNRLAVHGRHSARRRRRAARVRGGHPGRRRRRQPPP